MNDVFNWEAFNRMPMVGIIRHLPPQQVETLAQHYMEAGFTTLEVTMNSGDAENMITTLTRVAGDRLNIGAGTVCTMKDLDSALSAGARFIVTPVLQEEVMEACVRDHIPVFPGAYTPTEIYRAWSMGAGMVKVFPATGLGTGYIREVLAPLNHIKLMPTGGITLNNFLDFLKAGAAGLGMGSHLFPRQLIANGQWEALDEIFRQYIRRYRAYREADGG